MRKLRIILHIIIIIVGACFYHNTLALYEEDVEILIGGQQIIDGVFDGALGSTYNGEVLINNSGDDPVTVRISTRVSDAEEDQRMLAVRFFNQDLSEDLQNTLQDNNWDIVTFCGRVQDDDVMQWCNGLSDIVVDVMQNEQVRVPITIYIDNNTQDHVMTFVFVSDDGNEENIVTEDISYRVPDKDVMHVSLQDLSVEKNVHDVFNKSWFASGMQDTYTVRAMMKNEGTENATYTYFAHVHSLWTDEITIFESNYSIDVSEEQNKEIVVTVPRFGKVAIIAGIRFEDSDGNDQEMRSEAISLMIWPIYILVGIVSLCCFCIICVLLYKKVKKYMFQFSKNKKKDDRYSGSYVVKDTDNIISIAQMYNVPWKELVECNNLEAPYILIPGESIRVPGDAQVGKNQTVLQHDEHTKDDVNVQKVAQEEQSRSAVIGNEAYRNESMHIVADDSVQKTDSMISSDHPDRIQKIPAIKTMGMAHPSKMSAPIDNPMIVKHGDQSSKRKVSYAAPQNTLTQPSSEPTTRAIDIEWMRDDEEIYGEEMRQQQKKINVRLFIMMGIGGIVIIGLMWFVGMWILQRYQQDTVSLDDLVQSVEVGDVIVTDQEQQVATDDSESSDEQENGDDTVETTTIDLSDISVQVLNAGAPTGAAGSVSQIFTEKGYDVKDPKNAQNTYDDVTVYYASDAKVYAETIASEISEQYGERLLEESSDVVEQYSVDIVIVLGS